MSSMDTKKLKNIMTHFRESTGVLELSGARPVSNLASFISQYNNSDSLLVVDQENFLAKKQIAIEIKDILKEVIQNIEMSDDERGIVLSFHDDILFDSFELHILHR